MFNFDIKILNKMKFGVDGFFGGWCCCTSNNNGLYLSVAKDVKSFFKQFPKINYVFIDMPIGLSDYGFKIGRYKTKRHASIQQKI